MRKLFLSLGLLVAVALAAPAPAHAHFSISIGFPGFAIFAPAPCPPAVFYEPPVYYYPYRPAQVVYFHHPSPHHHGWKPKFNKKWWKHGDASWDD